MRVLKVALCILILSQPALAETKIPTTTSSPAALQSYLAGRDLAEKLRGQEARAHFNRAIELDPGFAMAHLSGSLTQATTREFFEFLERAVEMTDGVSAGERHWIIGFQAGVNGETTRQLEHYTSLVAEYPEDERAHNLLGNHWFGRQDWAKAVASYERATGINPNYTQSYNQMGYAKRFMEDFDGAEKAFRKYISLIPEDPNPYDSYAELLMKMGKFEASTENYRKALKLNPRFAPSHIGIATNLNYLGRHKEARKQLAVMEAGARDDGERRGALFATAVSYLDEGKVGEAIAAIGKEQAIAERNKDAGLKAGDLINIGNIRLEGGEFEAAMASFEEALATMNASDRTEKTKDGARRAFHYNSARVELGRKNLEAAEKRIGDFARAIEPLQNPFLNRQLHELTGSLYLARGGFSRAVSELENANLLDPYNLYRLARAHLGAGDTAAARSYTQKTVSFNGLNNLNYAIVRSKAKKDLDNLREYENPASAPEQKPFE